MINCTSKFCMPLGIISFTKHQFVLFLTIPQIEIPPLVDSWIANTPSVKLLCPQKKASRYIFLNAYLSASLLIISQVVSLSCKTVYRWVTTDVCFISDTAAFFSTRVNNGALCFFFPLF